MGAGAGAQKITTDVTGNDTAGMSVDEHSNTLKTLDEVFEGNRLDYDNTAFKIRSGVDCGSDPMKSGYRCLCCKLWFGKCFYFF